MVQIIEENRRPSSAQRFSQAFSQVANPLLQQITEGIERKRENEQIENLVGEDISAIRDPKLRQMFINRAQELKSGLMDYETIKKFAGEDVADFYKASPIGGKTKIVDAIVNSIRRGEQFGESLRGALEPQVTETPHPEIEEITEEKGKLNLPDFTKRPKGTTPESWEKTRKEWTTKNVETLDKARDRLKGNKRDILGTKKLIKINESHELPEGLERFIINPKTGDPYGIAQLSGKVPKAAQEWVKEIARFGNRAKDSFGSRVTNFDLYQYMKQFPNLINTPEGRRNILKMMEINYELDSLYDKTVQKIIDQKGSGNIPPDEVDRIARGLIKDREEELFDRYLNLESENEFSFLEGGLDNQRPSLEEIFGG